MRPRRHETYTAYVSSGFVRSLREGDSDFHAFDPVEPSGDVTGEASLQAFLGLDMDLTLAGRVGVGGTFGPIVTGTVQAYPQRCFSLEGAARAELTVTARGGRAAVV